MTGFQELGLGGERLVACASGALWWPAARLLCVADLHLGKAGRLARRGGVLLPPYETLATIDRLAAEIDRLAPQSVVCLGDSFDDGAAADRLTGAERARIEALTAGRDWIWITGNHDPAPTALPGRCRAELTLGSLTFRHAARPGRLAAAEISGHLHPKIRVVTRGGVPVRPCFLGDGARLILPAFGTYTGGLFADAPAVAGLLGPDAVAILTGTPCLRLPLAAALARLA